MGGLSRRHAEALARHDAILRDAVESAGGHVVKTTGDGIFAAFARAEAALMAALAPVRGPDGVSGALAAVFGVSVRFGMTLQELLAEFLRTKQLMMVLDNCEHLLEPVAELVEFLEHSCAGLVVLATSREGLGG